MDKTEITDKTKEAKKEAKTEPPPREVETTTQIERLRNKLKKLKKDDPNIYPLF